MNKKLKLIEVALSIIIFIGTITGCSNFGNDDSPIALVVVIGRHANQNEFTDKSFEAVESLISRAVYGGEVSVIIADGSPRYIDISSDDGTPLNFKQDANNSIVRNRRVEEYSNSVIGFLRSDATRAKHREVDLLAAIKEAGRVLHDTDIEQKYIVIMDSGISTTGRVDFTKFNLDALIVEDFITSLSETDGILPDLSGINVSFIGLGDVAYPQLLPDTTYPLLRDLWVQVLIACGVSENMMRFPVSASGSNPNFYSEDDGGFPFVTVVNFTATEINIREVTPLVYIEMDTETGVDVIETDEIEDGELLLPDVGFHPDTANVMDEENARLILEPYADAMINHLTKNTDSKLYLVGTTASSAKPGGSGNIPLSQNRANRLKEILVELGVPENRLITIGVGASVPEHLRVNEWQSGSFDTRLAQANRKATVYEINNSDFQEILSFNSIDIN